MAINSDLNLHTNVICVNVMLRDGDRYLFLKRSPLKKVAPNVLWFPGGKVDPLEDPYTAAMRELREETGLVVSQLRLKCVITVIHETTDSPFENDWLVFYFTGNYEGGELQKTEEGELVWLTQDQVDLNQMFPAGHEMMKYMFDEESGPIFARYEYDKNIEITNKLVNVSKR